MHNLNSTAKFEHILDYTLYKAIKPIKKTQLILLSLLRL